MSRHAQLSLAVGLAVLVMAALAAAASASRGIGFSVGSGELGRLAATGSVTFKSLEGHVIDTCGVTATISLAASVPKVAGTTAGRATAFTFERGCAVFVALAEDLPWPVTYQSFIGTLPNISGVSLNVRAQYLYVVPIEMVSCPYTATFSARSAGSPITSLSVVEGVANLVRGGLLCPISMKVELALRLEPAVRMTLMS